ncbi:MAG: polysaccharide biosynthesis C-terminal domain-containing protein, partial [Clostridia bacterium]|nr:polysaccharide biosynthesis C-terminal domain-containing protein [Clostridia bacterium]
FIFVKNSSDYYFYAIVSVSSTIIVGILNFFYVKKYCKIKVVKDINIKSHMLPMLILFSSTIATTIYGNSDITMLGIMTSEGTVGIYYLTVKIYEIAKRVVNSIIQVTIPRISFYVSKGSNDEKNKLLNQILKMLIVIAIPTVTGMILLKQEIIYIVGGKEFLSGTFAFSVLSIALIFGVLANFYSNLILITHKKEKYSLYATIIAAITNVVLNFILIPRYNEKGAAITTLIAEFVVFLITYVKSKECFKPSNIIRITMTSVFSSTSFILIKIICNLFVYNVILKTIIVIVVSIIVYFLLMILLDKEEVLEIKNGIK